MERKINSFKKKTESKKPKSDKLYIKRKPRNEFKEIKQPLKSVALLTSIPALQWSTETYGRLPTLEIKVKWLHKKKEDVFLLIHILILSFKLQNKSGNFQAKFILQM